MTDRLFKFLMIVFIIASCNDEKVADNNLNPESYFKNTIESRTINPGIGIGDLIIGETRTKNIFNDKYNKHLYFKNGVDLHFDKGDTLTEIILTNKGQYRDAEGRKIGTTVKSVVSVLGEPDKRGTSINKGETQIGMLNSLIYEGFGVIFLDSTTSIIFIAKSE